MQKYFLIPNSSNQKKKKSPRVESFGTNLSHILMQKSIPQEDRKFNTQV